MCLPLYSCLFSLLLTAQYSLCAFVGPPSCVYACICRSVDSPLALLPDAAALEEDVCDGQNWQDTVLPQLLSTLSQREVDRQAVIYGRTSFKNRESCRDIVP